MSLVSVIIPCYNAARHLPAALESVRAQTWTDVEVLAVDDGSTDATWEILKRAESDRVRIFRQANAGASAARNRGLAEARGDYLQYLDADDLLSPDKIENQIRLLEAAGEDAVAFCRWSHFSREDAADARFPVFDWCRDYNDPVGMLASMMQDNWMIPVQAWLISRKTARRAGPWNETIRLNDDVVYFTRILAVCNRVLYETRGRVYYRKGSEDTMTSRPVSGKDAASMLEGFRIRREAVLQREDSDRVRKALAVDFYRFVYGFYGRDPALDKRMRIMASEIAVPPGFPVRGILPRVLLRTAGFWNAVRIRGCVRRWRKKDVRRPA